MIRSLITLREPATAEDAKTDPGLVERLKRKLKERLKGNVE